MPEITAGTALRQLQQAQSAMKRARHALQLAKGDPQAVPHVLKLGWESLAQAHRLMAAIPLPAASEEVMTRQLAVQRYATALLVRLRRLLRNDFSNNDGDDDELADEDS